MSDNVSDLVFRDLDPDIPASRTFDDKWEASLREELEKLRQSAGEEAYAKGRYQDAAEIFREMIDAPSFVEFLTLPAYEKLVAEGR